MTQAKDPVRHFRDQEASLEVFADRDRDYMKSPTNFSTFLSALPVPSSFQSLINAKKQSFPDAQRSMLYEVALEQARDLGVDNPHVLESIEALRDDKTFVTVTAHQPCLMTGPAYFIYKIASTIALAKQIEKQVDGHRMIPVFVVGSEDHDFDEIDHLSIYGKTVRWKTDQGGPVGRMKLENIEVALEEVESILGSSPFSSELMELLRASYKPERTLAEATAHFVYSIFGRYGIVVLDPDESKLKHSARSIFEDELLNSPTKPLVHQRQKELIDMGYDEQIFVRDINLFWMENGRRDRITIDGTFYQLGLHPVEKKGLQDFIDGKALSLSPNVALRPVYQQQILPSIAYVGGGAEVAYWMELADVFRHFDIPMPMLVRRDSAMWLSGAATRNVSKLELSIADLFAPLNQIKEGYLLAQDEDWTLADLSREFGQLFNRLQDEIRSQDEGLIKIGKGLRKQLDNGLNKLESKIKRSIKNRHDVTMNRFDKLWTEAFPNQNLQERSESGLSAWSRLGPVYIDHLIDYFDPLEIGMHVFME